MSSCGDRIPFPYSYTHIHILLFGQDEDEKTLIMGLMRLYYTNAIWITALNFHSAFAIKRTTLLLSRFFFFIIIMMTHFEGNDIFMSLFR